MDSVTQFALGAGVGAAVLGRRMGVRKAALTGGLLGTLPDADVFFPFDDPVESFVLHRSVTHSLLVHAVAAPVIGELLCRAFASLREARLQTYSAVFLCFATHALLDAMTVYGTQLFWPLWPEPVGLGSLFIIDPLYTLPLLVMVVWALFRKEWTPRYGKALTAALVFSTAYVGWSAAAQQIVETRAERVLARAGMAPERLLAIPTPFNTLFWRAIAVEGSRYVNLYIPILGGDEAVTAYAHPRKPADVACWTGNGVVKTLTDFSDGFVRYDVKDGTVVMSDLRMGLTPRYVFRFSVAKQNGSAFADIAPQRMPVVRTGEGDMDWLKAGLVGEPAVRPVEAMAQVQLGDRQLAATALTRSPAC